VAGGDACGVQKFLGFAGGRQSLDGEQCNVEFGSVGTGEGFQDG
jgi:hypothetical protein